MTLRALTLQQGLTSRSRSLVLNLKSWIWFSHLFVLTLLQTTCEASEKKQGKNRHFSRIISYWVIFFFFPKWKQKGGKVLAMKKTFSFSVKTGVKNKNIIFPPPVSQMKKKKWDRLYWQNLFPLRKRISRKNKQNHWLSSQGFHTYFI